MKGVMLELLVGFSLGRVDSCEVGDEVIGYLVGSCAGLLLTCKVRYSLGTILG